MKLKHRRRLKYAGAAVLAVLAFNALFVRFAEGWSWIDSWYFSVVTFTTIGYGDLVPQSQLTKLILSFSLLVTFGVFIYSFTLLTHIRIRTNVAKMRKDLTKHVEEKVEQHVEEKVEAQVEKQVEKEVKEKRIELKVVDKKPRKKTKKKRKKKRS